LEAYAGTLIFASHDRRLIAQIATRLWVIHDGVLRVFEGTYDEYVERQAAAIAAKAAEMRTPAAITSRPQRSAYSARKQAEALEKLEAEVQALEADLARLGEAINEASARGNLRELERLGHAFREQQASLERLMGRWLS